MRKSTVRQLGINVDDSLKSYKRPEI